MRVALGSATSKKTLVSFRCQGKPLLEGVAQVALQRGSAPILVFFQQFMRLFRGYRSRL